MLVECNFCHKKGHREYECYTKKGRRDHQPGGQVQPQNQNNLGRQDDQQFGGGSHSNGGQRFQRQFNEGQGQTEGNRIENSGLQRVGN